MSYEGMNQIIEQINYAAEKLNTTRERNTTYDDDGQADLEDGRFCGERDAYADIIRECGERLSKCFN